MVKNIFRFSVFLIFLSSVFVLITPLFSVNSLVYPPRIDSVFVSEQQYLFESKMKAMGADSVQVFIYDPSQLNINYIDIDLPMADSIHLRGWMAIDTTRIISPLLLIIPDISEGAIDYIPALKEFSSRGFNVCAMDLRGQGMSDGEKYLPGETSVNDLAYLIKQLRTMPFINHVAVLGSGTGAGIAISLLNDSTHADVLILQNPVTTFNYFFAQTGSTFFSSIPEVFSPAIQRSYEKQTGINIAELNYEKIISELLIPQMFVTANFQSGDRIRQTLLMYDASTYFRKRLYVDTETFLKRPGFSNSKEYFDKISAFINSSLPYKSKKVTRKKLATNI